MSLFRERLWAFPLALFVLAVFVAYQLHRFGRTHSIVLLMLTLLDVVVMALIWREFRARPRAFPHPRHSDATVDPGATVRYEAMASPVGSRRRTMMIVGRLDSNLGRMRAS